MIAPRVGVPPALISAEESAEKPRPRRIRDACCVYVPRARATSFSMHSARPRRRGLLLICLVSSARGFGALCLVSSVRGFGAMCLVSSEQKKAPKIGIRSGCLLSILVSSEQKKINTPSGVCCDYSPDDASDLNVRLSGPSIEQRSADQPRPYRAPRGVALPVRSAPGSTRGSLSRRVHRAVVERSRSLDQDRAAEPSTQSGSHAVQRASPLPA